ncbi:dynein axonemal heavy chain 2, partial [Uranotaenia lowii]|uniref:dynein axonemal heavy chain 2 n=1 Tax=Uranotaenia lowii TaxID=190385 RepID=UPI002479CB01
MADTSTQDVPDNLSDVSSFTDSSAEAKKVVEVVEETVHCTDKPAYSEEDLSTLINYIRGMIFLFDYDKNDFSEDVAEIVKLWLTDANNPLLFIFYDGDILSASLTYPQYPFNDLMYFMRQPDQLFNETDRFHDDIMFGTIHSDIEGTLLVLLEQVYGPLILSNTEWSDNVKGHIVGGYNTFMSYLTDLHYKLSGFTLLYVPREGDNSPVQEVVLNRTVIKRLEAVVIDWTGQIRSTLSDTQHFVPDDLICPSDEYNFWIYRHEVLCAIQVQFQSPNVQHILKILELAQSLYVKPLNELLDDLTTEILIAESNIPFLKLVVDPCFAIRSLDNEDDLCSQLIYIMHIIRFIGLDSSYLNKDESITKLFLYLTNEIVAFCMQSINIEKIFEGFPNYGIEICNAKINCCESYKIIYKQIVEHFRNEVVWNLDYATIFNKIDAFIQRLTDVVEICETMMIFGKYNDSTSYKNYRFPCNNADEYEKKCEQVELIFHNATETIHSISNTILDINNKEWYKNVADFRETLRNLDDIIENLLSNVFLVAENLEEKIDVLTTLLNFYERDSIKESFMGKVVDVWIIFKTELTKLSKEVSSGVASYPTAMPYYAGQYTVLKIKFDRIKRLKTLLERCRFLPAYHESEDISNLFDSCEKQVKAALKGLNESWIKSIDQNYVSWYHKNLIYRSQSRPGLLECQIERRMLLIFDEAYFFRIQSATIPAIIDIEKHEVTRQSFDNVLRVVLYFNDVISTISEKERLFFKPMIQQTERKLEPLKSKLTWDEDLGDFIDNFITNVKELLDTIQVYKRENIRIVIWMEKIFCMYLFKLQKYEPKKMGALLKNIAEQKKCSLAELVQVYSEISKNIFCIQEHLGSHLRKMRDSWEQYVKKIDKVLKAAIFKTSMNTIKNIKQSLTELSSPILSLEIGLGKQGISYYPSAETVETALKRLPNEVISTIKIIPTMCQRFQIDSDVTFYDEFLETTMYLKSAATINNAIEKTVSELSELKNKWNIFRPFWSIDKKEFIEKFKLSSMTSESFQKNIEKFDELLNQLSTQNDIILCQCIEIEATNLKYSITKHINDWQIKYIECLKCVSYGCIF